MQLEFQDRKIMMDINDICRNHQQAIPPVLAVARRLFAKYGYHGTSARKIAEASGLSISSLYHRYPSKQAILEALAQYVMDQIWDCTTAADKRSDGSALGRFNEVIGSFLRYNMQQRDEAFLIGSEIRSMEPEVRKAHVAQRDRQQALFCSIVEQGVREKIFRCSRPNDAARALSSLCMSVSHWYRPDGPLTDCDLVALYLEFAHGIVGFVQP